MCTWEIFEMKPERSLWCGANKKVVLMLILSYFDLVVAVEDFGIHGWDDWEGLDGERKERKERNAIIYIDICKIYVNRFYILYVSR